MKTPRKIILAIILLISPILAMESNKDDNADIVQKEPIRKSCVETKDRTTGRELNSVIDTSDNIKKLPKTKKKPTAHFVGDAYGWIIVYY